MILNAARPAVGLLLVAGCEARCKFQSFIRMQEWQDVLLASNGLTRITLTFYLIYFVLCYACYLYGAECDTCESIQTDIMKITKSDCLKLQQLLPVLITAI